MTTVRYSAKAEALSDARFAVLLILPTVLGILLVVLFPLLYSFWMSLADVDLISSRGPAIQIFGVRLPLFKFVGLKNYVAVLTDPLYWNSFARTVYFVLAFVAETVMAGLAMALILHE